MANNPKIKRGPNGMTVTGNFPGGSQNYRRPTGPIRKVKPSPMPSQHPNLPGKHNHGQTGGINVDYSWPSEPGLLGWPQNYDHTHMIDSSTEDSQYPLQEGRHGHYDPNVPGSEINLPGNAGSSHFHDRTSEAMGLQTQNHNQPHSHKVFSWSTPQNEGPNNPYHASGPHEHQPGSPTPTHGVYISPDGGTQYDETSTQWVGPGQHTHHQPPQVTHQHHGGGYYGGGNNNGVGKKSISRSRRTTRNRNRR